jgi:hypothetical protein
MKSNPGKKLSQLERLNLTVNPMGKINIPSNTIKPGSKNRYLCLKFMIFFRFKRNAPNNLRGVQ